MPATHQLLSSKLQSNESPLPTVVSVLIVQPTHALRGHTWSYAVPSELQTSLQIGHLVWVNVAQANLPLMGVVVAFPNENRTEGKAHLPLKPIVGLLDEAPLFNENYLTFVQEVATYYGSSLAEALDAAIPSSVWLLKAQRRLHLTEAGQAILLEASSVEDVLGLLPLLKKETAHKGLSTPQLALRLNVSKETLLPQVQALIKQGLLQWQLNSNETAASDKSQQLQGLWAYPSNAVKSEQAQSVSPTLKKHRKNLLLWAEQNPNPVLALRLCDELGFSPKSLQSIAQLGWVNLKNTPPDFLSATKQSQHAASLLPELTLEQQEALFQMKVLLLKPKPTLLWGVTGSGKTEVYLHLAQEVLAKGKSVMFLLPEIALSEVLSQRVKARLGEKQVHVWHSQISAKEKSRLWYELQAGEPVVLMGARSAIFAPLPNVGLLILDEAHDSSFKQEQPAPRYDARWVAERLGERHGALVILGTATPTISQFYRTQENLEEVEVKPWPLVVLRQRFQERPMPPVTLQQSKPMAGMACLSHTMAEALKATIAKGEQAILLLNRRGFHTLMQCQDCGHVFECDACSVSLTYHKVLGQLSCHQCNERQALPQFCPHCASTDLKLTGAGTQRLEEEVLKCLDRQGCDKSDSPVVRLDGDTLTSKSAYQQAMEPFTSGKASVLVGTQLVAKGLDIPNVTFVGVIQADAGLSVPDFKAQERLFQLLTQVAGRAGRGQTPGHVLLQVIDATNPVLNLARQHNFEAFYQHEVTQRKAQGYPPFSQLLRFIISGEEEDRVSFYASAMVEHLKQALLPFTSNPQEANPLLLDLLGPALCVVAKVRGHWRYHALLKNGVGTSVHHLCLSFYKELKVPKGLRVSLDVDPESLL
jgi:primosomal protein N' (replication factor Y) (superfamily II helicase)